MSKTLEIWHKHSADNWDKDYLICSPDELEDGSNEVVVDGFETDLPLACEDGRIYINIDNDDYFLVEIEDTTHDHRHAYIEKTNIPPKKEYEFPYTADYTFSEKVECVGIPDSDAARDQFKYMPHVKLVMEWGPGMDRNLVAIKVNGERHELD